MTATEVYDLAFKYAEEVWHDTKMGRRNLSTPSEYFADAAYWFKKQGGNKEDYSVFEDMIYAWMRNNIDSFLGSAYCNAPDWESEAHE